MCQLRCQKVAMASKWILAFSVAVVVEATGVYERPKSQMYDQLSLVGSNNLFGFDVFRAVDDKYSNVLISPWSLFTALGMVQLGAQGDTLKEIDAVMHLRAMISQRTPALFSDLQKKLQPNEEEFDLKTFNAAIVQEGYNISKLYRERLQKFFSGDIYEVDFIKHGLLVKEWFNAWAKLKTGGKIKDVLGSVPDPLTRLMLVSTSYFRGIWQKAFDVNKTRNGTFYKNGWEKVTVPMMVIRGNFSVLYTDSSEVFAVDLPMEGGISFLLVMPSKHEDFEKLENDMSPMYLASIKSRMMEADIQLFIPKFKAESKLNLQQALQSLGMVSLFRFLSADLSGIATSEGLYVSDIVHQVYLGVDEEGAEASAISTITIITRNRITSMRFDRPFLFFITDTKTGLILFVGRVTSL